MTWELTLFHCSLALALFVLVNWIGPKFASRGYDPVVEFTSPEAEPGFNFAFRVATPLVFLVLVSSALYSLGLDRFTTNIHYTLFWYVAIRTGYNLTTGKRLILPWGRLAFQSALIIWLGWLLYNKIISTKDYLFPDLRTIGNELWLAMGGYLFILANHIMQEYDGRSKRADKHIASRSRAFFDKYDALIGMVSMNKEFKTLVYSVMIVEDFNRPGVVRWFERLAFRFGQAKTLGVMQVETNRLISDAESVSRGAEILHKYLCETIASEEKWRCNYSDDPDYKIEIEEQTILRRALMRYNPSAPYVEYVQNVMPCVERTLFSGSQDSLHPQKWTIPIERGDEKSKNNGSKRTSC